MGRRQAVFFLLLIFSVSQLQLAALTVASTAPGNHADDAPAAIAELDGEGVTMLLRKTTPLGSRPPSCEGRCRSSTCGGRRCEAVQVPVAPHDLLRDKRKTKKEETESETSASAAAVVRRAGSYDDRSNYKPLGWRCKCLRS